MATIGIKSYNKEPYMTDYSKEADNLLEQGKSEIKKSGSDWLDYIEKNPLQSMIFGLIGYFAIKGIIK